MQGRVDARDLALEALAPTQEVIRRGRLPVTSLGGGTGIGSVIYGLVRAGELLGEPELLVDADRAAALITDDLVLNDQKYDTLAGAAGALLGFLALDKCGSDIAIKRAGVIGRHLVGAQISTGSMRGGWPRPDGQPLTGMSHGAAGISLALARLADSTDDDAVRRSAQMGLEFERSCFDEKSGNWPDLRLRSDADKADAPDFPCRWCHGAPGIGLARLGMCGIVSEVERLEDVEAALSATIACQPAMLDLICCGTFGRLEFLLEAGIRLDRPELVAMARARAMQRLTDTTAGFTWARGGDHENLSFHQGVAGIGYVLLRLCEPGILPSVLSWN